MTIAELQQVLNCLDEDLIVVKEDKSGKAEVVTVSLFLDKDGEIKVIIE